MEQHYTVLTGDLVSSRALSAEALEQAMNALAQTAEGIALWAGPTRYSRHRGDGWQLAFAGGHFVLRAALVMRAGLRAEGRAFSTRIGMAQGPGTIPADGDLNRADGAAFVAAGDALDALGPGEGGLGHAGGGTLQALARLADQISAGWTPAQAQAAAPLLAPDPPTHAEVASRLGKSRQAVDQAAQGAGLSALRAALSLAEAERADA
ncbi:MarR family transcriptional regulator [Pseudothioclava nitratireducens]|uniref:MarR family transcriptional regulator n=1 Tax=Pseudothioclava nitratireducens TaxID=1928646 RepID=UPI0023D97C23|nr:MarR family transcriptional regulator [Defluviimonas nitratireducens]MDF1621316.1 MarR family transcriptional regulator [Defluviimonas nitratireducens]